MGMSGLREMLKALNKSHMCSSPVPTDSFVHNKEHHYFPRSTITLYLLNKECEHSQAWTQVDQLRKGSYLPPTSLVAYVDVILVRELRRGHTKNGRGYAGPFIFCLIWGWSRKCGLVDKCGWVNYSLGSPPHLCHITIQM